ncbi:MAG: radical SAM protein [Chloroflexaceae bacterium]|jgi:hypothetical protein|nr:radical SAM protein [Chloroflexaceae bacterium]
MNDQLLAETESVCPHCLQRIPARRVARGAEVLLCKTCPEHGYVETVIWRGEPALGTWLSPKTPSYPRAPQTQVAQGCPYDCGLCPEHQQHSCCVLLEVTQRCDLKCAVCFADAGKAAPRDPDLATIETWFHRLLASGGPCNIQLSGGEPCVRDDLPEIAALGRSLGFSFVQVNSNGLRLARDPAFAQRLRAAGVSTVFLQFDGTDDAIFTRLRGRPLFAQKQAAIEQAAAAGLGVVLVPTLVPGVNVDNIGAIIAFALAHMPVVRGVHFQPISYFGRYPQAPTDQMRITIPEVIQAIATQTNGQLPAANFAPPGGEHAMCSFHGNFVLMPDGQLLPLSRNKNSGCCGTPAPILAEEGARRSRAFVATHWSAPTIPLDDVGAGGFGAWDVFLQRAKTHTFCVSGMAFQDAWTLDLERLRLCYIHEVSPDGMIVPFCAYNLTAQDGRSLYRTP